MEEVEIHMPFKYIPNESQEHTCSHLLMPHPGSGLYFPLQSPSELALTDPPPFLVPP